MTRLLQDQEAKLSMCRPKKHEPLVSNCRLEFVNVITCPIFFKYQPSAVHPDDTVLHTLYIGSINIFLVLRHKKGRSRNPSLLHSKFQFRKSNETRTESFGHFPGYLQRSSQSHQVRSSEALNPQAGHTMTERYSSPQNTAHLLR